MPNTDGASVVVGVPVPPRHTRAAHPAGAGQRRQRRLGRPAGTAGRRSRNLITARCPLRALDEPLDIRLAGLRPEDARDLFIDVACGAAVPDAVVDRVLAACQHLPLAIRVAAARVRGQSPLAAADLLVMFEDDTRLLTVMDDGSRSVARSFESACAALPSDLATTFAILSVHLGHRLDAWAVAAG
ncbi:hypothetical protein [Dactylosporangium sp. CA-139066]|uniref:hypothetical protein n=1 Tax=Dactylosporangium sp. CA-139066 TaxID=3239930 RepID=UPI003D8A175D